MLNHSTPLKKTTNQQRTNIENAFLSPPLMRGATAQPLHKTQHNTTKQNTPKQKTLTALLEALNTHY